MYVNITKNVVAHGTFKYDSWFFIWRFEEMHF